MTEKKWRIKWCPHAKSAQTPCYLRDGEVTLVEIRATPVSDAVQCCVGCERSRELLDVEKRKLRRGGTDTC